jgi:DNA repair exonuclease SbcCD ATPase subunit
MANQIRLLNNGFIRHWFVCGLLGLGLTSGLPLGGWGLTTLAKRHISSLHQNITALSHQKASLEATLKQLESKTWGLSLIETPEGRFIILPPKATLKTGWTFGKQPAVKLEEAMSELQTLALEHLVALRRELTYHQTVKTQQQVEHSQRIKRQTEALKALEAKQDEFEKLLRHLSELYNRLMPLIETINSDVRNGPL